MAMRVAVPCSGLGHVRRGFERFTEDLGRALQRFPSDFDARVVGAHLPPGLRGTSLPCLRRSWLEWLGSAPERAYRLEQLSFAAALAPWLVGARIDVAHVSDAGLSRALHHARDMFRFPFRIVFCNSGPIAVEHWKSFDHVQLVAPWQYDEAMRVGISRDQVTFLPMGIELSKFSPRIDSSAARTALVLPSDGLLLIAVAALDCAHKRLDYVISELAGSNRRWSLVCVGQPTAETPYLKHLAEDLAPGRVHFRTAGPEAIPTYLAAADALTLASRNEGFGLALLEGMAAGLPVIARDVPSLRFLVSDDEQLAPLLRQGELSGALDRLSSPEIRARLGLRNRERSSAFAWDALVPAYVEMYQRSASCRLPRGSA